MNTHADRLAIVLAQYTGDRASVIDQAIRGLRSHEGEARTLLCELIAEVHADKLWKRLPGPGGIPYRTTREYLRAATGYEGSFAYYCLKIGKLLRRTPMPERLNVRIILSGLSHLHAFLMAVMILDRGYRWERALSKATTMSGPELRQELMTAKAGVHKHPQRYYFARHLTALGAPPSLVDEAYDEFRKKLNTTDAKEITARILSDALAYSRSLRDSRRSKT